VHQSERAEEVILQIASPLEPHAISIKEFRLLPTFTKRFITV
jgi:hypothetical protein